MPTDSNQWQSSADPDEPTPHLPAQLRDPMGAFRRQKSWILATFVVSLIAAIAIASTIPLTYEARGTIILTAKSIPDEFVPTTIIAGVLEQFETIRGAVFSRSNISQIIEETGAYDEERDSTSRNELVDRFRRDVSVEAVAPRTRSRHAPQSVTFEVRMRGGEPKVLAAVVNRTISDLVDENIRYRSQQARLTTEFMKREFERADTSLREHQRKLAEFRARHRGALPEERATALAKLDRLEEQRRSAILRINDYQSRAERLDLRPNATTSETETIESLRSRLQHARSIFTDEHPTVKSLERQVSAMETKAREEGPAATDWETLDDRSEVTKGIELEQLRLAQIDEEVARLEERLSQAAQISDEYDAMLRQEQILQENYVEYLRKLKNAELSLSLESAQQGAQLTRLDTAHPPTEPVRPRWQFAAAGAILSIGLALCVGAFREFSHPVFVDKRHLEEEVSIPILGSVGDLT